MTTFISPDIMILASGFVYFTTSGGFEHQFIKLVKSTGKINLKA